ncbi:sensor histidine kinase [Cryptosporangium sp. NPDC048952]|uniref:sensor histidine kinase n=1 Tax=Cryptosporangium sp. NPDC048952 TaxID=3363961 RepID=UPI003710AC95
MTRWEEARLFVDGICTDVTDCPRLDEQREQLLAAEQQQVKQLRELDRTKDELVAVVSHELRNSIGVIRGYAEFLLEDPDLPAPLRDPVEIIDRKSAQLREIVDDLLDLARIDAGHIDLVRRPMSLTHLIEEALADHAVTASAKHVEVNADVAPSLTIVGDATRLRQALDNLLANAIKYTPAGGTVGLTARRVPGGVQLAVCDTGIGSPPEQLPRLFTRFFRAGTALEHGISGTGLGLTVTKAIVEAHGGSITAASGHPTGTVFSVWLPNGSDATD